MTHYNMYALYAFEYITQIVYYLPYRAMQQVIKSYTIYTHIDVKAT